MYGSFGELPGDVREAINKAKGRLRGELFWVRLISFLWAKKGSASVSQKKLLEMLGYQDAERMGKYREVLVRAGLLRVGNAYSTGAFAKRHSLTPRAKNLFQEHEARKRQEAAG
jgi:hypothetical protein